MSCCRHARTFLHILSRSSQGNKAANPSLRTRVHSQRQARVPFSTASMAQAGLTLYTWGTPNGKKASVTLEELGLPYEVVPVDISTGAQKEERFLKINPNGRIPALVDHDNGGLAIFESGAIMWYLAERDADAKLLPKEANARTEVMEWLMFQMGGIGPMVGQAFHFSRAAPEKIPYAINRYVEESRRLFQVLERGLQGKEWLAANQFSIADIANFTWVRGHDMLGISLEDMPNVKAWLDRIEARPAVGKGLNVPSTAS